MEILVEEKKQVLREIQGKIGEKEEEVRKIEQILELPIYMENSYQQYVLPEILALNKIKSNLQQHSSPQKSQHPKKSLEQQLQTLTTTLLTQKLATETHPDKLIDQLESTIKKKQRKIKFFQGQKLQQQKNQIKIMQNILTRILKLRGMIVQEEVRNREGEKFGERVGRFREMLVGNGYGDTWGIIEKLIEVKYSYNSGKQKQQRKNQSAQFIRALQIQISKIKSTQDLTPESIKIIINETFQSLQTKITDKKQQKQRLIDQFDNLQDEALDEAEKKCQNLKTELKLLDGIVKQKQNLEEIFREMVRKELIRVLPYINKKNNNEIFKQLLNSNPKLSIKINFDSQDIKIEGHLSQSFFTFAQKMFVTLSEATQSKSLLKITEKQYTVFENSGFSQEAFDQVQKIINFIAQILEESKKSMFKTKVSQFLTAKFEKVVHIDQKNWPAIFSGIVEATISFQFKDKNKQDRINSESNKATLIKQLDQLRTQLKDIQQQITDLNKGIQNNIKQAFEMDEQHKNTKKLMELQRERHDQAENNLEQCKKLRINLQLEIDQTKNSIVENDANLKTAEKQKVKIETVLKDLNNEVQALQIVDREASKQIYEAWKIESQKNFKRFTQINIIKNELSNNIFKINKIQEEITIFKQKAGDNNIEQVSKKIQQIQEQLYKLSALKTKIKDLTKLQQKYQLLQKKLTQIQKSEKSLCKCLTNHKCQQLCQAGCPGQPCSSGAGHPGKHLCKQPNHKCQQKCTFNENCQNKCNQDFNHSVEVAHCCGSSHVCTEKCKYCDKGCSRNVFEMHEEHICQAKDGCHYKCLLCDSKCASPDHRHDNDAGDVQMQQENKETKEKKMVIRKLHLCNNEHSCYKDCSAPGICAYTYRQIPKKWVKNNLQRDYIYFQQIQARNKCLKKIPAGKAKHEPGQCSCLNLKHQCDKRCPDCGSLCGRTIGHPDKHKTEHRNQEQLLYAAQKEKKKIKVGKNGEDFIFQVGDISLPTRCYSSCESKGRSHYHLIQCKGEDLCLEKKLKTGAKHSRLTYYPYTTKKYDMVLCKIYWEFYNFQPPIQKQQFDLCNFVCPYDHEDNKNYFFCTSKAWHSFSEKWADHTFECDKIHKPIEFNGMEICFLIDATGSMDPYIPECKKTIQNIIIKAESSKKKLSMKFAIVGYRDHQMSKSAITINLKRLCEQKKHKLRQLPTKSFFNDLLTQREFVRQVTELQKKYEEMRSNENLRACFTERELFILDYHFPFYFDVSSSDDMVSQRKLQKLNSPLSKLLSVMQDNINQKQSLIFHLQKSLEEHLEQLLECDEKDKLNKLVQVSNFSNSIQTIQFLDYLRTDGGGDPPEAVLDGMDEVCNLSWSKQPNVMRYVFHLFDAPPHGRIYSQNNGDRFPDQCPCGKKHESIIKKIHKLSLTYIIYPLTSRVNTTLDLFENSGLKFERKELKNAHDVGVNVVEIVCRGIEQNQIMINKGK